MKQVGFCSGICEICFNMIYASYPFSQVIMIWNIPQLSRYSNTNFCFWYQQALMLVKYTFLCMDDPSCARLSKHVWTTQTGGKRERSRDALHAIDRITLNIDDTRSSMPCGSMCWVLVWFQPVCPAVLLSCAFTLHRLWADWLNGGFVGGKVCLKGTRGSLTLPPPQFYPSWT